MNKTVQYIIGDGIGPEVFAAARPVIDAAVAKAYGDSRRFTWNELLAGQKAYDETGNYLPQETLDALSKADLALKGPLATPVGGGIRSLNVTMRQTLDLYACIRPIKYFKGIESPVKRPDLIDMIVFRENTEDVYAGIEWPSGSDEAKRLIEFLRSLGKNVDQSAGIGIKPMTAKGSKRLIRKAIQHALAQKKPSVTLVHKGNIMKFTEGAFRAFGYEMAAAEFPADVMTELEAKEGAEKPVLLKDRIADAMFQEVLLRPEQYSVIATTNLNGDYLSDALAAQVGGLGLAPGVNMSEKLAFFEATHGTAPAIAGLDMANPGSLILCGAMLLDHLGWSEASTLIHDAMNRVITDKTVTIDLAGQIPGSRTVGCAAFGDLIGRNL